MLKIEIIEENLYNPNMACAIIKNGELELYAVYYMQTCYKAFAQVKYINDVITYKSVVDEKIKQDDKDTYTLSELDVIRLKIACELIKERYEKQVEEMRALFM